MLLKYDSNLKQNARNLRRNLTDAERILWQKIRKRQIRERQFLRQKAVDKYIVDFYCEKAKLVIEIDGGQHYEEISIHKDIERDEHLQSLGLRVLRFTNLDVLKNMDAVIEKIYRELKNPPPTLP